MNYYYSIDGTEVEGPYTFSEVNSLFSTGNLPRTTQVCREGQQTWEPITSIFETAAPRASITPVSAKVPLTQGAQPVSPTSKPCPMCGERILATAKKCKHCGEYLDGSGPLPVRTQTKSDTLGIVIMLLPLGAAALMWFWINSMSLIQNPSSTLMGIVIVTIIATSSLMAVEANQLGIGGKVNGKATTGPAGWFMCGLLLWIVGFPAYLYCRSKFGVKNYVVGGLFAAFAFLGVAVTLNSAIETQKASVRRSLEESQEKLRELQHSFERFSR